MNRMLDSTRYTFDVGDVGDRWWAFSAQGWVAGRNKVLAAIGHGGDEDRHEVDNDAGRCGCAIIRPLYEAGRRYRGIFASARGGTIQGCPLTVVFTAHQLRDGSAGGRCPRFACSLSILGGIDNGVDVGANGAHNGLCCSSHP